MSRTVFVTASGRLPDLLNPRPEDIYFGDIAEHLAKENRYNGATKDVAYSVAQHLVVGADEILRAGHDPIAAAYFLCHDMHEAYLKDDPTPKKRAIATIAQSFGILASTALAAFDELTERWDAAIHEAAGLQWPPPREIVDLVDRYDRLMLLTEWRSFMSVAPAFPTEGIEPLPVDIVPWPTWQRAHLEMIGACRRYLPGLA